MRTLLIAALTGLASLTAQAADATAGRVGYDKHFCGTCHGPNGAAPPNVAKLADGRITDLRSAKVQSMSDADLSKIVTNGIAGKMRSDTTLSGKDLQDLLAYLRSLKG